MDELLALLREIEASDDIELADGLVDLAEQFGRRNDDGATPLDDDQLKALIDGLVALGAHDDVSGELIGLAADVAVAARGEREALAERLEAEEAARQEQLARLRGDDPSAEDETPTEPDGDDTEDGGDEGDEPDESGDVPADEPASEAPAEAPAEPAAPEPVAAAAAPARRPAARRALRRRTPAEAQPREAQTSPGFRITLGADLPGIAAGSEANEGLRSVDRALLARAQSVRRSSSTAREKVHVATVQRDQLIDDRRLVDVKGRPLAAHDATERIQRAVAARIAALRTGGGQQALVAAGGLCAPLQPIYAVDVLGETGRPVRDEALVSFQATRGGIISTAPPTIAEVTSAIGAWTVTDDETAAGNDGSGDTLKNEMRVECGDPRETEIEAITRRLIIGNMLAMTYGEWVDAISTAAMIAQDRLAEQRLLAAMRTKSIVTTVETPQASATLDTLDVIRRAVAGTRSRHRASRSLPFRVILPDILFSVMQTDLSRRMPSGTLAENLVVAEELLNRAFSVMGANVTWSPDLNVQGAQAAGALAEWPDQFQWMAYPEGTFVHLDAGELDLGTYRDHDLNSVNDAAVFAETFEGVHLMGTESIAGTISVCPSGATVGTIDPAEVCGANS